MTLTPGKWIAFQTPSQKANITEAPGEHWSVGIEHHDAMCHGVAEGGGYMLFSGIGTKADALAMAAAPALLEACEAIIHYDTADQNDHVALMLDYASMIEKARAAIALAKGESA